MANRVVSLMFCSMLAGSAVGDVVVRDTIATNTWRNQPTWIIGAANDAFQDWPSLTFAGNGHRVQRLGVIAMFTDDSGGWNPPTLSDDDFDTEIGFFTSLSDWNAQPARLSATIGAPSNANWLAPIATYGGIKYHYLEFNLASRNFVTSVGTNVLSVTFNPNGAFSNAIGYLAGGLDGVTDYLYRLPPGPTWKGTLNGFYSQYGRPFTNVAAIVWLESPPCPADLNADTVVDDADFVVFAAAYNLLLCSDPAMASGCPADLNSDDVVDDADFVLFAVAYNELLCP